MKVFSESWVLALFVGAGLAGFAMTTGMRQAEATERSWNGRIIEVRSESDVSLQTLALALASEARAGIMSAGQPMNIVLGEKHYTAAVQQGQAKIIEAVVGEARMQGMFTTAWEFLNASEQPRVRAQFQRLVSGEISAIDFLKGFFPQSNEFTYAPILEVTKRLNGELLAVNLTRAEKAPVVKSGLAAADPAVIPPGFEMVAGEGYLERFREAMAGGHANPEQVRNYYEAQCLTDDVMAHRLLEASAFELRFLVVGSFHVDYRDGTVSRIRDRAPGQRTTVIRFVDASDYQEKELPELLRHPQYGAVADFVYFVNEPAPAVSRRPAR